MCATASQRRFVGDKGGKVLRSRAEIFFHSMYMRGEEGRVAQIATDKVQAPVSFPEQLILSHAHDALGVGEDGGISRNSLLPVVTVGELCPTAGASESL